MHPWVACTGLILLWADAVVSQARVHGVVGQPVTLPCTYSTAREITSMCWGRGACPFSQCSNELIWTDGYRVTFQKNKRYDLHGLISRGNVSLTIRDAAQSDSGTYCCRVEHTGWFNDLKMNLLLDVKPAPPKVTSAPTSPTSAPTTSAPTVNLTTAPPKVTHVPASPRVFTYAPTASSSTLNLKTETVSSLPTLTAETQPITPQETNTTSSSLTSYPIDGNSTVMQPLDSGWQSSGNHMNLKQNPGMNSSKAVYIGLITAALIVLTILAAVLIKEYLCVRRNVLHISKLSWKDIKDGTSKKETAVYYQANENIYFENNLYKVQ